MKYFCLFFLFFSYLTGTNEAFCAVSADPQEIEKAKEKAETDFKKAENLLYSQKHQEALPELIRLCHAKYLRACSLLGFSYYTGRYGVLQNSQKGIEWYQKCADEEKNYFCHKELGRIYYRMEDYERAFSYYKRAAVGNDTTAQFWLGKLYMQGKGVPIDYRKGIMWLKKAAHSRKNPSKEARCALSEISYFGIGMERNIKDTKYWLKLCDNSLVRALMLFYGHGVKKDRKKAKEILIRADLKEALSDWDDLNQKSIPTVGKKIIRDQVVPQDCLKNKFLFGTGRSTPKISTYVVKIFNPDFYYAFDAHDGYIEKIGIGDRTIEACGINLYTTKENWRLFHKALRNGNVIKISRYKDSCLNAEITEICNMNLKWQDETSGETP